MKRFTTIFMAMLIWALGCGTALADSQAAFKDVPASYWGYKNIQRAYTDGVVSGSSYNEATSERYYSPETNLTMAQFTTILTRAFYADELAASTAGNNPWYAATQEVCEKHDLTNGYNFVNAEYESSRYQMARIMYYVLVDKGIALPSDAEITAAQSKIADWNRIPERNKTSVATVFAMGLITGKDDAGNFVGNDSVTRAEAATVYCRLADVINAGGSVQKPEQPVEKPNPGNYGPVGTLSDTPVTLSLSTHKPVVDYWSKAPADVQAITDKDMFNAAVQTIKDREIEIFEKSGPLLKASINDNYNYACWDYSKVDNDVRRNISAAIGALSGYGTYGLARNLDNADNTDLAVIIYSFNNDWKKQYDEVFAPIFAQFRSGMSDKEKAEIMLKAITDRFDYGSGRFDWFSDGKTGDCDSFSDVVKNIFNAAGIPTTSGGGTVFNGKHAWNYAYLDGKWYAIDAVSADAGYNSGIFTISEHAEHWKYNFVAGVNNNIVTEALVEAAYN